MEYNKLASYIQKVLKKEPRIVAAYIFGSLASLGSFGGKVHKRNDHTQQAKVNKKQCPKYSNVINSHLTSLNRFIPILKNSAEIVKPNKNKRIWGNSILEVKRPNIQEARAILETSKQNLAISSFCLLLINKISLAQVKK